MENGCGMHWAGEHDGIYVVIDYLGTGSSNYTVYCTGTRPANNSRFDP